MLALCVAAALIALTLRICRARDYGTDATAPFIPEQARRRGGRVYLGCWRVA